MVLGTVTAGMGGGTGGMAASGIVQRHCATGLLSHPSDWWKGLAWQFPCETPW